MLCFFCDSIPFLTETGFPPHHLPSQKSKGVLEQKGSNRHASSFNVNAYAAAAVYRSIFKYAAGTLLNHFQFLFQSMTDPSSPRRLVFMTEWILTGLSY